MSYLDFLDEHHFKNDLDKGEDENGKDLLAPVGYTNNN